MLNNRVSSTIYKLAKTRLIQFTDREERRQCDRFLVNYKDFQIFQKSLVARFPSGVRYTRHIYAKGGYGCAGVYSNRGVLPFGVTLLISGWYDCKHTLFQCVAYYAWKAKAIGKNYFNETTFLEIRGVPLFSVSLLISEWDDGKPSLFQCDPSVVYYDWKSIAIGKSYIYKKAFLVIRCLFLKSNTRSYEDLETVEKNMGKCLLGECWDVTKFPYFTVATYQECTRYKAIVQIVGYQHLEEMARSRLSFIGQNEPQLKVDMVMEEYIQTGFFETLEMEDAVHSANLTLKERFEGQTTAHNIEVGVCSEAGFRVLDSITKRIPCELKETVILPGK
uniref:Uncharacterized protein n=1 Tax=Rhodnius prolixus TaxID=13249 RepID=T1HZ31_RHOPR